MRLQAPFIAALRRHSGHTPTAHVAAVRPCVRGRWPQLSPWGASADGVEQQVPGEGAGPVVDGQARMGATPYGSTSTLMAPDERSAAVAKASGARSRGKRWVTRASPSPSSSPRRRAATSISLTPSTWP